jgi:transcriptional regulator with XRE-family HTH domain
MTKLPFLIKEKAITRRRQGYSLQEIADECNITKSTASLWLRNIQLDSNAKQRLASRVLVGQAKTKETKNKKRKQLFEKYLLEAKNEIDTIHFNTSIIRLSCALLFWCEGSKNTIQVKFTNSDPEMVKYYLQLLRKGFSIDESKLRALVHLHEYHNEQKQIDFWSKVTRIPKNQFYRSYKKPHTHKRVKENYPGCICVTYFDANLAKKLWAYYYAAPRYSRGLG